MSEGRGGGAYAPFRPVRSRRVCLALAGATLVVFGAVAALVPEPATGLRAVLDRLGVFAFGVLIAVVLWRFASIRADPSPRGLHVRNLLLSRDLEWAQVVAVHFGGGGPWVVLDLADGDTLAVMAVQRSDGVRAQQEASRLASLVIAGSRTDHDR